MPYHWSDDYGARIGVMPRNGGAADLRWFEIEPCYVFHPWNAYETADGRIVLDVARYPELWRQNASRFDTASAHRFTLDPKSGNVKEERLDERPIEFPRIDDRLGGSRHRYGYTVAAVGGADEGFRGLLKYDFEKGGSVEHDFGPGRATGEGVFVAAGQGRGRGLRALVPVRRGHGLEQARDPRRAGLREEARRGDRAAAARALRLPRELGGGQLERPRKEAGWTGGRARFDTLPGSRSFEVPPLASLRLALVCGPAARPRLRRGRGAAVRHREGRARAHRAHRGGHGHDRARARGRGAAAHPGDRRAHLRRAGRRRRARPAPGRDRPRAARLAGGRGRGRAARGAGGAEVRRDRAGPRRRAGAEQRRSRSSISTTRGRATKARARAGRRRRRSSRR